MQTLNPQIPNPNSMATDVQVKFRNPPDLLPIPQPPDYHTDILVSPAHDGLHSWQFMIAGSIAGMVEHLAILKSDGPAVLYRGIGAMGLVSGPAHVVYEVCKKSFSGNNPNNPAAHSAAKVFATAANNAVFTPMYMVKQRLQLSETHYKGVMDCVMMVLREVFRDFYAYQVRLDFRN